MAMIPPWRRAAVRRAALDLVGDGAVAHREDLKAARVGDDRPVPAHELVQAAEARDALVAGVEEEVEGVAEDDVVAEGRDLGRQHPLDRRLGRQGHEGGRAHLAVGGAQDPRAGPRAGVAGGDRQGRHREHARSGVVIAPLATFVDVAAERRPAGRLPAHRHRDDGHPGAGRDRADHRRASSRAAGTCRSRPSSPSRPRRRSWATTSASPSGASSAAGLLTAPGPFLHHRRRVIAVGEPFFDRHGPKAVFLGRWVTGLRITAAWMAGATRMSWPTFLFWNALGGIAWATSIGLLAYFVGHSAEKFIHLAGLGGAVLVVLGGVALWFVLRARRRRAEALVEAEIEAQIEAEAEARPRRARTTAGPRRARARRLGGRSAWGLGGLVALDRRAGRSRPGSRRGAACAPRAWGCGSRARRGRSSR